MLNLEELKKAREAVIKTSENAKTNEEKKETPEPSMVDTLFEMYNRAVKQPHNHPNFR